MTLSFICNEAKPKITQKDQKVLRFLASLHNPVPDLNYSHLHLLHLDPNQSLTYLEIILSNTVNVTPKHPFKVFPAQALNFCRVAQSAVITVITFPHLFECLGGFEKKVQSLSEEKMTNQQASYFIMIDIKWLNVHHQT